MILWQGKVIPQEPSCRKASAKESNSVDQGHRIISGRDVPCLQTRFAEIWGNNRSKHKPGLYFLNWQSRHSDRREDPDRNYRWMCQYLWRFHFHRAGKKKQYSCWTVSQPRYCLKVPIRPRWNMANNHSMEDRLLSYNSS